MIPVTQTKVVVRNSEGKVIVRGNCQAAVIASLLELPITEVPNVETLFHIDDTLWYEVMNRFLASLGYDLSNENRFKVFHDGNFGIENGKRLEYLLYCKDRYYMVSGRSSRGVMHVCIFQNGEMVHDPHPTREGILTFECFEELTKIETIITI